MSHNKARSIAGVFIALVLCVLSGIASAEIIDDIRLKTDANGEVDAVIKFTVPIHNLRYFPPRKSQYLVIYFNILGSVPRDQWQDYESHRFPPSDSILGFTITTRDLNTGPKIQIQFNHPAEFSIKVGRDFHSLYLHIKPDQPQQNKESKRAPAQAGGVAIPPITPPAIAVSPTVSLPGVPVVVAAQPAQSPVVSGVVAKPPVVQPNPLKPLPALLGGKDGLPVFPAIEQPAAQEAGKVQPAEDISLADQIRKANSEAAVLMAKGRDALLAGQMFAAIDAFNNTLKLPLNKYSPDAQLWIGIAREKSGQQSKAALEYDTYLKLYPDGAAAKWVKERLARLNAILPPPALALPQPAPVATESNKFNTTEYGSLSMYYYHGASHTDTIATVGTVQTPTSLTVTDQSSLITNMSVTARSNNDEFDNRLVLQDFYAANFLAKQRNTNRLNAAFFELRNRIKNYSARVGRQSAVGGGVLGRFDGVSGGFGFSPNWRANVVAGQLSDIVVGSKPVFYGATLDFGVKDPMGGSIYAINQKSEGILDRKAVGGNLRYFEQRKTALVLWDYDTQFRALNMVTIQGTLNGESGTDFNFLLDRRMSPSLSIRNSVNGAFGTTVLTDANGAPILDTNGNVMQVNFISTVNSLLQNGFTTDDLIGLAKKRTATSNSAQFGVSNHIREKWLIGTDITVSNTSGMPESGTQNLDGTTGKEGFIPATSPSGNTWVISERLIGNNVIASHDVSILSLSYATSHLMKGTTLQVNNHAYFQELWTLDSTLRLYWQTDNSGGKETIVSPMLKVGYRVKSNLTFETEGGIELTKATPSTLQSSKTNRKFLSLGFRWDF